MRSVDFPGIIAAAAASTLGVLSLIVLGVGLLAWAFFKQSGEAVKIGVFAAIFLAALGFGAATIRESGAYRGSDSAATGETPASGKATDAGSLPVEPSSPPPALSPAPPTSDVTNNTDVATPTPDALSFWQDSLGYTYAVATSGSKTKGTIYKDNAPVGYTEGTISGSNAQFRFVNLAANSAGNCTAQVSPERTSMDGTCTSDRGPFPFHSERQR